MHTTNKYISGLVFGYDNDLQNCLLSRIVNVDWTIFVFVGNASKWEDYLSSCHGFLARNSVYLGWQCMSAYNSVWN